MVIVFPEFGILTLKSCTSSSCSTASTTTTNPVSWDESDACWVLSSDKLTATNNNCPSASAFLFASGAKSSGVPPESATIFCNWLKDMAQDFRVPNTFLSNTKYAVFGLGSSEYAPVDRFCTAALELDEHMYHTQENQKYGRTT